MYRNFNEFIVMLIALATMVLITIGIKFLINKYNIRKNLPFLVIAIFLLVFEITKIIFSIVNEDISFRLVPLYLCSGFLIYYPLATFFKGRLRNIGYSVSLLMGFGVSVVYYIYPSVIIGNATDSIFTSFNSFHTFIYHNSIVLFTLLIIFIRPFSPQRKDTIWALLVIDGFTILSYIGTFVFNYDYARFMNNPFEILQFMEGGIIMLLFYIVAFTLIGCLLHHFIVCPIFSHLENNAQENETTQNKKQI